MSPRKYLHEDLVAEILVKLPAKSLVRFKCVARSWNALFGSHTFISRHAQSSSSNERLAIFHCESFYPEKLCITLLGDDPSRPPQDLQFPFVDDKSLNCILPYGPCNGIFCLYACYHDNRCQLILWNPATREVKVVPPHLHRPSHDEFLRYGSETGDWIFALHGFGVDPTTNDLKVVRLVKDSKPDPTPAAEVYNLSTDSWTIVHDTVLATTTWLGLSELNTHVNGVYHWFSGCPIEDRCILCFDFSNNQFRKLKLPITVNGSDSASCDDIAEVNDSLAYVVTYFDRTQYSQRFEIWILNQDGVEGSWNKMYSVGPLHLRTLVLSRFYGVWKDGGEILVGTPNQPLVSYNFDSQPVRQFQINVANLSFSVHKYAETIAPLSA